MSIYIKLISIAICTCCLCLVRFIFNNDNRSIVKHRFMILGTFWILQVSSIFLESFYYHYKLIDILSVLSIFCMIIIYNRKHIIRRSLILSLYTSMIGLNLFLIDFKINLSLDDICNFIVIFFAFHREIYFYNKKIYKKCKRANSELNRLKIITKLRLTKLDTLKSIKQILNEQSKKIICVSTQVVEAGVNFSFGCVVRSKAGLDNIIQAAGRCNRHKELGRMGTVFIVQMSEKVEKLSHLQEIRNAQAALQKVLEDYKNNSLKFRDTLDSEEAIKAYYLNYYSQLRTNETKFLIDKQTTTIIELLGENKVGQLQYIRRNGEKVKTKLPQAFLTAGQAFEVISNDYKVSVVVPYNDEARELLDKLSQDYLEIEEQKKILKKLQRYTVGISEKRKEKLGNAIYEICNGEILVLCDGYYDKEVGVVNEPNMELQML